MGALAYYNEFDPYTAQWLRNLITAGHIAPGVVDERSIEDVHPDDLREFTQCHFFAGVGAWSYALRLAGWPDDRPVWTGSCPCQPFSAAGAGAGFDDKRHLWPAFHWLIQERRPGIVIGEQVASKDANPWLDLVQTDLEAMGYAFGAVAFPSAGVGAPHIRDRLYWVADANSGASRQRSTNFRGRATGSDAQSRARSSSSSMPVGLGHADGQGLQGRPRNAATEGSSPASPGWAGRMANADGNGRDKAGQRISQAGNDGAIGNHKPVAGKPGARTAESFWSDADWLLCRDGKWRPVRPGSFPLVARAPTELGRVQPGMGRIYGRNRTGRLRGYGNAINAQAAAQFIAAYMEA